jgi:uncharacterized iron-regulated membrane protein
MKQMMLPSADSPLIDWLIFAFFLLLVCACVGGFVVWMKMAHGSKSKRKRRKHRHHRRTNPTLAETGGLPPPRAPDEQPPGP